MSDILQTKYNIQNDVANEITTTYLRTFRQCPDNPDVPLDAWRQHLWGQALPTMHKHLAMDLYLRWLELRYKYLELKPDTITLLQTLRQSYLLAIITNGPSNAQWEKINRLNINKYFDCILVSADLPWEKPDLRIFYAACNYLGTEPSDCIMIGDKLETDIEVGYTVASYQVGIIRFKKKLDLLSFFVFVIVIVLFEFNKKAINKSNQNNKKNISMQLK